MLRSSLILLGSGRTLDDASDPSHQIEGSGNNHSPFRPSPTASGGQCFFRLEERFDVDPQYFANARCQIVGRERAICSRGSDDTCR
jgi:hypothetical protein